MLDHLADSVHPDCPIHGNYCERAVFLLFDQVAHNGHQWMFSKLPPPPLKCEVDAEAKEEKVEFHKPEQTIFDNDYHDEEYHDHL
jgi:hypothetical protein